MLAGHATQLFIKETCLLIIELIIRIKIMAKSSLYMQA